MTNKCTLILLTYFYCSIVTNRFQPVEWFAHISLQ